MKIYEAGVQKTIAVASMVCTVVAGTSQLSVLCVSVSLNSGSGALQLGRPAANGTGTLTGSLFQPLNPSDPASGANAVTSFGTLAPTAPAIPFRIIDFSAFGQQVIWEWDQDRRALLIDDRARDILGWTLRGSHRAIWQAR